MICIDERFQRTLSIKERVLQDKGLLERIGSVATHHYGKSPMVEGVRYLGEGESNTVYGVGKVAGLFDGKNIHLALRMIKKIEVPLIMLDHHPFNGQITDYERWVAEGKDVPYFMGIVTWKNRQQPQGNHRYGGLLTEDLTEGDSISVWSPPNKDYLVQFLNEGERRVYIDGGGLESSLSALKYFEDHARIDLP